jgi:leucyl aminopeptidase
MDAKPNAAAIARLASGAVLRGWRYDTYRTKLSEKQKVSLKELVIVGAPEGVDAAWAHQSAIVEGVALTR